MLRRFLTVLKRHSLLALPPAGVAAALVDALPGVVGAAICIQVESSGVITRLPVAVSDDEALRAEQWEFTAGTGPGLHAARTGRAVSAGLDLPKRWPGFAEVLTERTQIQAMYAAPLDIAYPVPQSALLLYLSDPSALNSLGQPDFDPVLTVVAAAVAYALPELTLRVRVPTAGGSGADPMMHRLKVNIAVGIVMGGLEVDAADALSILRGYARPRHVPLEAIADQVINGDLSPSVMR